MSAEVRKWGLFPLVLLNSGAQIILRILPKIEIFGRDFDQNSKFLANFDFEVKF